MDLCPGRKLGMFFLILVEPMKEQLCLDDIKRCEKHLGLLLLAESNAIFPVKLNFDLEQIATEFILMAYDSTWVSTSHIKSLQKYNGGGGHIFMSQN